MEHYELVVDRPAAVFTDGLYREYSAVFELFKRGRAKTATLRDCARNAHCPVCHHRLQLHRRWTDEAFKYPTRHDSSSRWHRPFPHLLENDLPSPSRSKRCDPPRYGTLHRTAGHPPHRRPLCFGCGHDLFPRRDEQLDHGWSNPARLGRFPNYPDALLFPQTLTRVARNHGGGTAHGTDHDLDCSPNVLERPWRLHQSQSVKLVVSYVGTNYFGWQKTKSGPSIQEALEKACAKILQEKVTCEAASRTDRGVHAEAQVVQFYLSKAWPEEKLQKALNSALPRDIRIVELSYKEFHPSLDATGKTYFYDLCSGPVQDPFFRHLSWHYPYKIDLQIMRQAASELIGQHDFSAFTTEPQKNPLCTLMSIDFVPLREDRLRIVLTGDRFLYKMARTLAGTLANIGSGKLTSLPQRKDRRAAGVTAPPHGLTLSRIYYGELLDFSP